MARTPELARLFQAVAASDWRRARAVADAMVATAEKEGRHAQATTLRGALSATGPRPEPSFNGSPLPTVSPIQSDLLTRLEPAHLRDVRLGKSAHAELIQLLREHRHRARLKAKGLVPRSRVFLHGPPGCGKTLTARAIAGELGLPVWVVRFDALVGSYLGQTATRLSEVFRFAEAQPSVLLLDEIDAIGTRRGKPTDVGELDRIVISLMQQLDLVNPAGLLIAASNIPRELDPALLRRFDLSLELPAPSRAELLAYAKEQAELRGLKLVNGVRRDLESVKTFAQAEQRLVTEQRRIILRDVK